MQKMRTKSRTICDLEASTQDLNEDYVPAPEPVVLFKRGKVVNKGKGPFAETDCRRLDQNKMRSCIQARSEDRLTDYEKLQAANIKRNAMVLSALGIPEIGSIQKNKKTKMKEAEKKTKAKKGKEIVKNITQAAIEEKEAPTAVTKRQHQCWSCKTELGTPGSLFCGQCGRKQVLGSEVGSSFPKRDLLVEPNEPNEEVDEAIGIPDTLLTYERVFHPRPGRLPTCKTVGKGFFKEIPSKTT